MHTDSLVSAGADRGELAEGPCGRFQHVFGITLRRYRELLEQTKRKDENGKFVEFSGGTPMPIIDIKAPFYIALETAVLQEASDMVEKAVKDYTAGQNA